MKLRALYHTAKLLYCHPLARRNRFASLSRMIRWQLSTRIHPLPTVLPYIEDTSLIVERGMHGATGNYYFGLHEFSDMSILFHFLRPSDTFLDVGANIGSYTVLASGVCKAKSISLEPAPSTFKHLLKNIRHNSIGHLVTAYCCAAGKKVDKTIFSIDRDTVNSIVDESFKGRTTVVEVTTLNHLLASHHPSIWKLDVEGHEYAVLMGASEVLLNPKLSIIILEGNDLAVQEILHKAGFTRAEYEPFSRQLSPVSSGHYPSLNMIWVRNWKHVQDRCSAGPTTSILGVKL